MSKLPDFSTSFPIPSGTGISASGEVITSLSSLRPFLSVSSGSRSSIEYSFLSPDIPDLVSGSYSLSPSGSHSLV